MYTEEKFQGTNAQISYTGRKIRMPRTEEPQKQQETHKEEGNQGSVIAGISTPKVQKSQNHEYGLYNDPTTQLIRSIERNLNGNDERNLIGVFGMNSNTVVNAAFKEVMSNSNNIVISKSFLTGGVYGSFAAMIKCLLEGACQRDSRLSFLVSDIGVRRQIEEYLLKICSSGGLYDYDYIATLSNLDLLIRRSENCKELMRFIDQKLRGYNFKFIWNIEISPAEFDPKLLKSLSEIACDNLIIIVNFLRSFELEAALVGSSFGLEGGNPRAMGYDVLQKYFWHADNLIQTD